MPITAEQCVLLLRDALANRPADEWSAEFVDWHAEVVGIVRAFSSIDAVRFEAQMAQVANTGGGMFSPAAANRRATASNLFLAQMRSLYTQLRLETNTFQTAQVPAGAVHDYFEEVRQIVAGAAREVLFIDPYLDATFVDRYIPQIPPGVSVRLLTSQGRAAALAAAVRMFAQQHGTQVEVRSVPNQSIHDRHLVIDGRDVYQSGASFKDGARNAPTSINQIVDVAAELIRAHEVAWNAAPVVP